MAGSFRVIDTGIRPARRQIAFDQGLIDLHQRGVVPDTLRFLQFRPTALVGLHQALAREINLDYCRANGIEIGRRVTGGGAIYLDEGQLGWELAFKRRSFANPTLAEVTRTICEAAAAGISALGVPAAYRPFSDIEVDGRKISGTGGFFDGDTLFYQGTLLIDMNPEKMVNALNIPQLPDADRDEDQAERRVVTITELLGEVPKLSVIKQALTDAFAERFELEAVPATITDDEEKLADQYHDEETGTDSFVHAIEDPASDPSVLSGTRECQGGIVNAHVRLEGPGAGRIRQVLISGNFFVAPGRTVLDLESALRGLSVREAPLAVDRFFEQTATEVMTVQAKDFRMALESALSRAEQPGLSR